MRQPGRMKTLRDVEREVQYIASQAGERKLTIVRDNKTREGQEGQHNEVSRVPDSKGVVFTRSRRYVDGKWREGIMGDVERNSDGELVFVVKGDKGGLEKIYEVTLTERS